MKHLQACLVPEKIEKAVSTVVEALRVWCKHVYVWERPDIAVLITEAVL